MTDAELSFEIRGMLDADVEAAVGLSSNAGWNQTSADWLRLLAYQTDGCFVACCDDVVVGTVTTTAYENLSRSDGAHSTDDEHLFVERPTEASRRVNASTSSRHPRHRPAGRPALGWIGMMLVDPQYRRRGIATALMRAAMDYLQEIGVACIKLDATPEGEFVYRRLGFESEWPFQRWMREGDGSNAVIDSGQGTYHPVSTDEDAFGVDRTVWLRLVAQGSRIVYRSSHCPAFGMLRQGANASYLGPVTAADSETAESIVRELLKEIRGRVIWDMPSPNTAGVDLCRKLGFQPVRDLLRMWTGRTRHNPNVSMQFGFCDPGTG